MLLKTFQQNTINSDHYRTKTTRFVSYETNQLGTAPISAQLTRLAKLILLSLPPLPRPHDLRALAMSTTHASGTKLHPHSAAALIARARK